MRRDDIVTKLGPWLAKQQRHAWKPIVRGGEGPAAGSKFGGTPWTEPNAPWPACGCCKKPLPLFLQICLDELPAELGHRYGSGLLQLFYCTRDDCQGMGGWDPFEDNLSRVRVISPSGAGLSTPLLPPHELMPAKQIIGWTAFADLPAPPEHDELGLNYTYDFDAGTLRIECPEIGFAVTNPMNDCPAEKIAVSEHGDKLAGWPAWVQGVEYPTCPRCGNRMIHVFQVDSEDNIPFMFGDVGRGHITQCPEHKEVVAFGGHAVEGNP